MARLAGIVLGLAVALLPAVVEAACTTAADVGAVRKSLRRAIRCNNLAFRFGPNPTCPGFPPPVCAGTLVDDAVALAYGTNDPPGASIARGALRPQLACQKAIGRAVSSYVGRKLRGLVAGRAPLTLEASAARRLETLARRCAVTVAQDAGGVILPAVGFQCGAAIGPPAAAVDAEALRSCLHQLLRVWVDRVGPNPQPLRPNILFILTDDQRWDTTDGTHSPSGAFVMPRTRAELADSGVEFTRAYMTTPLCCPSRASILAGQYAHRTGVYKNDGANGGADDFADTESIAVWLRNAGYRTSLMGKYLNGYSALWALTDPPYVPPGWTDWYGMRSVGYFNYRLVEPDGLGGYHVVQYGSAPENYSTDVLREKAKAFISDAVAHGQPFFLYLAFKAPHSPWIPAPRHEGLFQHFPPWRPPSWNEADVSDKPTWLQNTPLMSPDDIAELDQIRIDQMEMLQAVDEAIGGSIEHGITGIMQHLRNLGIADDTIVVFFSDNGWLWGEHRLRAKNQPYEEAIRSPLLIRYPRLAPLPRIDDGLALNLDFAATFTELAGVGAPIVQDGLSLVRRLDGTAPTWRTDFLAEGWPGSHPWATVHDGRWKYTEIPLVPGDPGTAFERELYDLATDPFELQNLAAEPEQAPRVAAMAARLRQLRPNWPVDSDPEGPDPLENE